MRFVAAMEVGERRRMRDRECREILVAKCGTIVFRWGLELILKC
jgi:hypothetical protein